MNSLVRGHGIFLSCTLLAGCGGVPLSPRTAFDVLAAQRCLVNGVAFPCEPTFQWSLESRLLPVSGCVESTAVDAEQVSCSAGEMLLVYEVLGYSVYPPGYQVDGVFPLCCPILGIRAHGESVFRVSLPSVFPLGALASWSGSTSLSTQVELLGSSAEFSRTALCIDGASSGEIVLPGGEALPIFRAVRRVPSPAEERVGMNPMAAAPGEVWGGAAFEAPWCPSAGSE